MRPNRPAKTALVVTTLLFIQACSSGESGPKVSNPLPDPTLTVASLEERFDRHESMGDRVDGYAGTGFETVPTRGSATFNGVGTITVDPDRARTADDVTLVGFARITTDFADDAVTGQITNIEGYDGRRPTNDSIFPVLGRVNIGGRASDIVDNDEGRTNRWNADYQARLELRQRDVSTLRLDGELDGQFRGARPAQPTPKIISGIRADDSDGRAIYNGTEASSMSISINALNASP